MQIPMLGRRYHYVYGYAWRHALLAEIAWRVEHIPVPSDDTSEPLPRWRWLARIRSYGYRQRHKWERRGAAAKK